MLTVPWSFFKIKIKKTLIYFLLLFQPFFRHLHMHCNRQFTHDTIITKIYKNSKSTRTYTKLVSYKKQKKIYLYLSFDNLSAERFLNYLLENYAFLNFDLLSVRSLNFPKISVSYLELDTNSIRTL